MIDFELKIIQTPLTYYMKDAGSLWRCHDSIIELIADKKDVPAELLVEYFSYFINPEEISSQKSNLEREKMKPLIDKVIKRFKKDYDFNFTIERDQKDYLDFLPIVSFKSGVDGEKKVRRQKMNKIKRSVRKRTTEYSLKNLIYSILYSSVSSKINSKDECIKYFHKQIRNYCEECAKNGKEPLSKYAQGVIAGYITHGLGFKLTSGKSDLSNQELFDKVRNALGSFKKKGQLIKGINKGTENISVL